MRLPFKRGLRPSIVALSDIESMRLGGVKEEEQRACLVKHGSNRGEGREVGEVHHSARDEGGWVVDGDGKVRRRAVCWFERMHV